jgi:hypothetical protein
MVARSTVAYPTRKAASIRERVKSLAYHRHQQRLIIRRGTQAGEVAEVLKDAAHGVGGADLRWATGERAVEAF